MATSDISPEKRRRNIRLALLALVVLALFMFVSAVPFWRGLYNMVMGSMP